MAEPSSDQIHVSPNLEELVNGIESSTRQAQLLREQRDVNDVVHQMLIVGLVVSTALMVFGLALDIFYRRVPPTTVPQIGEVLPRMAELRPSGFLAAGLLVLIATPILRVAGSIFAFLHERDFLYAGITAFVLLIVLASLLLGKG
ncbi:DUF1634 domain-containing protein [Anaerolineae bacterium CFX7]|nr:DUF1634 domain-containing protein [Anaerolineae bacterium CFX7]